MNKQGCDVHRVHFMQLVAKLWDSELLKKSGMTYADRGGSQEVQQAEALGGQSERDPEAVNSTHFWYRCFRLGRGNTSSAAKQRLCLCLCVCVCVRVRTRAPTETDACRLVARLCLEAAWRVSGEISRRQRGAH